MIETEVKKERVAIVGVETEANYKTFSVSMDELASLVTTAGGEVILDFTQKRERADGRYLVGKGKLEEIRQNIEADEIDTVVFNERLSPRQNMNLEEYLGVKVIDRMQLILDIFAARAKSYEGMLQVELAQLKYMLPRLVGKGIALSRQAGGIGSRGPGESQLEMDRRYIRTRIENIEKALKKAEKTRLNIRQKRQKSGVFRIGLIGYTNAGKSSIFNALTDKIQYEKDELFATLDATTKDFSLKDDFIATLTDTVGFIQDLPTELVDAFKSTLEESSDVDLLIHVIDASNPDHEIHEDTVKKIMSDLDVSDIPVLNVYNKADLTGNDFTPTVYPHILISAKNKDDIKKLKETIVQLLQEVFVPFTIKLPYAESYKLPDLKKITLLEEVDELDDSYKIKGSIAKNQEWRIEDYEHI
ncbi:GTPase HflX [Floricoccus tropicus]|uniref:GTPase HflX n=1 Tax=Floricoccus tropicus TaxID=1859473 RepID=A0A1E8GJ89_9LACT|nr:GTPase HflX [Floricoccus tropicus]OFI48309.1 GTPase HflX [Floricoccus tropicus]